jgi:hypothetical protein
MSKKMSDPLTEMHLVQLLSRCEIKLLGEHQMISSDIKDSLSMHKSRYDLMIMYVKMTSVSQ